MNSQKDSGSVVRATNPPAVNNPGGRSTNLIVTNGGIAVNQSKKYESNKAVYVIDCLAELGRMLRGES